MFNFKFTFLLIILIVSTQQDTVKQCSDLPILPNIEEFIKQYTEENSQEQTNLLNSLNTLKDATAGPSHNQEFCKQFQNSDTCCNSDILNQLNDHTLNFYEKVKESSNDFGYILYRLENGLKRCLDTDNLDSVIEDEDLFNKIIKTQNICQGRVIRTQMRYYRGNICGVCIDPQEIDTYFTSQGQMNLEQESFNDYMEEIDSLKECLYDNSLEFKILFTKIKENIEQEYPNNQCQNVLEIVDDVLGNSENQIKQNCSSFNQFGTGCIENLIQQEKEEYKLDIISLDIQNSEQESENDGEQDGESEQQQDGESEQQVDGESEQQQDGESEQQQEDGEQQQQEDGEQDQQQQDGEQDQQQQEDGEQNNDGEQQQQDGENEEQNNQNRRILNEQNDYTSQVSNNDQIQITESGIKTYITDLELEKKIIIRGDNQGDSLPSIINDVSESEDEENDGEESENKNKDKENSSKNYIYLGIIGGLLFFSGAGFFCYQKYKERQTERQITYALDDFEKDEKKPIIDSESQKSDKKEKKKSSRKGKKKSEVEDESLELSLMSNN